MERIQFIQTSPEDLVAELQRVIKTQVDSFLKEYKPKAPNEYLTKKEVAELFDVDISTIGNWCKKGKLNPLALGSRVYFLRSEVDASLIPLNGES